MSDPLVSSFDHPIGWVLRAHGLRGQLTVKFFRPRRLEGTGTKARPGRTVHSIGLRPSDGPLRVFRCLEVRRTDPSTAVVALEDLKDRSAAESWVGSSVLADPRDAPSLLLDRADGLIGARAILAETGMLIGIIRAITDNGAQPVLVVGEEPEEILVPFVEAFVVGVEASENGRLVKIAPIEGLLELNRRIS